MTSATTTVTTPIWRRSLLAIAGLLALTIGLPLYVAPQNSDVYSRGGAWYLSAAFLRGAYLSAAVIDFSAARKRIWPNAGSRYQRCSSSPC